MYIHAIKDIVFELAVDGVQLFWLSKCLINVRCSLLNNQCGVDTDEVSKMDLFVPYILYNFKVHDLRHAPKKGKQTI